MNNLKETIELMESVDYKDRFKAEYYQLKIRYEKLKAMLDKWDNNELDFEPTCPRDLYDRQIIIMKSYLDILADRAKLKGVKV